MLILAASPGPGVFATVARALASGFRPALAVIGGIVLGDIIFLLFAAFGLSMVARALGNLFFIVKLCGGAYLIWLGIRIWLKDPEPISDTPDTDRRSRWGNFVSGLVITLSNPKVILFYCGFLPTFLPSWTWPLWSASSLQCWSAFWVLTLFWPAGRATCLPVGVRSGGSTGRPAA